MVRAILLSLSLSVSRPPVNDRTRSRGTPRVATVVPPAQLVFFFLQEEARNRDLSWPAPPRLSPQEATCLASPRVASPGLRSRGVKRKTEMLQILVTDSAPFCSLLPSMRLSKAICGSGSGREEEEEPGNLKRQPREKRQEKKLIKPVFRVFTSSCSSSSASSRLGSSSRSA